MSNTYPALFQNKEFENLKLVIDTIGLKFHHLNKKEPVYIEGQHLLIPISLLKNEKDLKSILSLESWNKLTDEERFYLKKFLPCKEEYVEDLFKGKSRQFNKELNYLVENIIEGNYHPDVVQQRENVSFLKRKFEELENLNKKKK